MTAAQHTIIYAVRHGETQLNRDGRLQGTTDTGMTPLGVVQIQQAAAALVDTGVTRIICSPLLRARQSAEILARQLRLPIIVDNRLIERSFGELEGTVISLLLRSRPQLVHRIQSDPTFAPPGGESEFAVVTRARDFVRDLVSAPDRASPAVLVGHGSWLSIVLHRVLCSHTSMLGNGQISTLVLTRALEDTFGLVRPRFIRACGGTPQVPPQHLATQFRSPQEQHTPTLEGSLMEHTTTSKALGDLLFNNDIMVTEAVDKHFAPDFRQRTNGTWMTREEFTVHMTTLRELVGHGTVTVHEELVSGILYAEHHTIDGVRKDGGAVIMEVYAFGEFAEDGRLGRLEEATLLLSGTDEDRELSTMR